jgi:hypothetical protein
MNPEFTLAIEFITKHIAFEPNETSSPVDLGCQIPAKCASFMQLMRELINDN